jgi:ankyrin repeat protein
MKLILFLLLTCIMPIIAMQQENPQGISDYDRTQFAANDYLSRLPNELIVYVLNNIPEHLQTTTIALLKRCNKKLYHICKANEDHFQNLNSYILESTPQDLKDLYYIASKIGWISMFGNVLNSNQNIEFTEKINATDVLVTNPLCIAIRYNRLKLVRELLESPGINPNIPEIKSSVSSDDFVILSAKNYIANSIIKKPIELAIETDNPAFVDAVISHPKTDLSCLKDFSVTQMQNSGAKHWREISTRIFQEQEKRKDRTPKKLWFI